MTFRRGYDVSLASSFPALVLCTFVASSATAEQARSSRQIEEIVVTAEKKESTVQDTSISITAFTGEFLEDFGIRNQEDLQNYIPAAVIEPYDMAIRGVGRNFRALGGDPGIATYLNGVYSEDFGIASTEGGLFDVERIEVLRGPQGTLYGRNAIGGAVNFINKLPSDEFEGEARVLVGDYELREYYGVVSGPVIPDLLQARLVGTKRVRDGYFEDLSPADDAGNYGDENYALSLRLTPTDALEVNTRVNERSYARRMGGADAAGIVVFSEEGNIDGGGPRDNSSYVFGYRAVDPTLSCGDTLTRTTPVASPGVRGGIGCTVPGRPTFDFRNPVTGATVTAQRVVPGVDSGDAGGGTTDHPNRLYTHDLRNIRVLGFDDLEGSDLETETSGQQDEFFDQQAVSFDVRYEFSDTFAAKYIFGYTDYFYDRTSDVDLSNNPIFDEQYYVSQETEYVSHELQLFFDPTEALSITSGLFVYDAKITQRGDFYDSNCTPGVPNGGCESRYANDVHPALAVLGPKVDLFTAKRAGSRAQNGLAMPPNCLVLPGIPSFCFGGWTGDTGDRIAHGPATAGTDLEYSTRSERNAYAAYTQGVYTFNEHFALTMGLRWARDDLDGEENLFNYTESAIVPLDAPALAATNIALGYLSPDGNTILNPERLLIAGIPASQSLWRPLDRTDEDVTWRVNLDWMPSDEHLIYLSATKGFRAGGFNLVFFSANAKYKPESLIAYELGYKGQLMDGAMQVNSAIYLYDYENVHTFGQGPSLIDPSAPSTSVFAVPSAEMVGWDTDVLWLVTDRIMVGGNFSYTHSEYTDEFLMIDAFDPNSPESLFSSLNRPVDIEGNQMLRVPEMKGGAYAQYTWPFGGNLGRTELLASWTWIDKVYFSPFENDDDAADPYSRWDVRATWFSDDESWQLAAFVNNVLDEVGIRQIDRSGEEANFLRAGVTTDPRLYGLEVRYRFGALR
jgi:outer membrane receptor protein involved in Fe transport